jgi:hypothetical protein
MEPTTDRKSQSSPATDKYRDRDAISLHHDHSRFSACRMPVPRSIKPPRLAQTHTNGAVLPTNITVSTYMTAGKTI